jgi:hypothetical protein
MAKIRRNWSRLPLGQRITKCKTIVDGITDNPTLLPNPAPSLAALTTLHDEAKAAADLVTAAEQHLDALRADSKTKNDAMVAGMNSEASTAEGATGGDEVKLRKLGFTDLIETTATASAGPLEKVSELSLSAGDNDGELDAQWNSQAAEGAKSYEVQTTATVNDGASWQPRTTVTKSSAALKDLPSGTRQWVRVRAIGSAGPGPWSDPVSKMVP